MYCRMNRLLVGLMAGALALAGQVSQALTAGDVSLIGYRTDAPDGIAFVTWVDLPGGTSLYFTDAGFFSDGTLRDSEDIMSWTAPAGGVTAGTVVTVSCPDAGASTDLGTVALKLNGMSASGDQVFVGDAAFPDNNDSTMPGSSYTGTLLFGLATEAAWLTSGTPSANTSFLPSALNGATLNLAFTTAVDNGQYTGARTGMTISEYKAALVNPANWTREDAGATTLSSTDFSISGGTPSPSVTITDPSDDPHTVPNATAAYDVVGTSANAVGFLSWSNGLTHASGSVAAAADWSIAGIALDVGDNLVILSVTNAVGQSDSNGVTIVREAALTPSLTVTTPVGKSATVSYATTSYELMGSGANLAGTLTWSNALTAVTGTAAAGATWSLTASLDVGVNAITVFGTNVTGMVASDIATITRAAQTSPVTPGNVLVYCVDGNGAALGSDGTVVKVLELAAADGALVQTFTMPSGASGTRLTASGTATSEGKLTVSPNGAYAALAGYDAAENTASVKGTLNRTIARIAIADGSVNLTTTGALGGNDNTRGVAVADTGSDFWLAAAGATGTSDTGRGPRYLALGQSTVGPQLANINIRGCRIFGGQLYEYGAATGNYGVYEVGSGLPTSGTPTMTGLPGLSGTDLATYGIYMADLSVTESGYDTLWMARDTTGISKYSKVGGTWTLNNTLATSAAALHIDGARSGSKTVVLYAVVGSGDDASRIVTLTDGSGYNANMSATFADFALDGAYQSFRGVAVVPAAASAPWLEIADPAGATLTVPYATAAYTVAGTAGNLAGTMTWTNALTTAAGSFAAAAEWSVAGIALDVGANAVIVAGTNVSGTAVSAAVTITREADLVPSVTITAPAAASVRVGYETATFAITGTTANVVGTMTWSNGLNAATGSFPAGSTWDATLALDVGINAFTFVGTNANGTAASDTIDVRRLPEQVLAAGDLAFVGFNTARDAFAIVALADLPANTRIWFTDEEWNGSGFVSPTGEADVEWNTGVAVIPAGTVVTFDLIDQTASWTVSHGAILSSEGMGLAQTGEDIYAYLGDMRDPFTFLGAISTAAAFDISNTGLVLGQTAIQLAQTPTALEYNGARDGQAGFASYLPLVNDVAQWGAPTDPLPFDTTAFVLGSAAPELVVTTADDSVPYATTTYAIDGTFANLVGEIVWSNGLSAATGTATDGAGTWDATVPLAVGANLIVVSGTNAAGTVASDGVTITRQDAPAASVTISTPDAVVPYATTTFDAIEGSADNAVGTMVLANSLGGSVEQPADLNWVFEEVELAVGVNTITITVSNVAGVAVSDTVTIIRQAEASTDAMRIASFSDPHYFAPSLLIADGPAFQAYLGADRKLIAESAAITKAVVDQIIARNANYVFVTGDLTKDGELASHVAFSNELARLEAAGAQVLVIPGNHDVNGHEAVSYNGTETNAVPNVSPAEFQAIYAPFGYDLAVASDPGSLAYAVDLTPSVRLVCLDDCQYGEGQSPVAGSFDAARLAWATNQMALAQAAGKLTVGMMHHGLMEHFQGQKQLFAEYVVDDYQTLAPLFASLGMKAVFTGHFHANDIVAGTFAGQTIYDIETGSTVTWPCPYRVMELDGAGNLDITTHRIAAIDYDLGDAPDFQTYAYDYLANGMVPLSAGLLYQTFTPYLSWAKALEVAPAAAEAIIAHYAGDEVFSAATGATQAKIVELMYSTDPIYGALYQQIGGGLGSLLTDLPPPDNNTTLDLDPAPTVSLTAPTNGIEAPLNQAVTVTATASDARGVTNVALRVDGVPVANFATAPYTTSWTPTAPGSYALTAVAYDNAGQSTVSATVTVETPPLSILDPADGSSVDSATDEVTVSFASVALVGNVTFHNAATGETITVPAGTTSANLGLVYGLNIITVTGNDGSGDVSDTLTITRTAPTPVNGGEVLPGWNYQSVTGSVHIAWTTNDWYQFQNDDVCLPGTFLYRDPVGGTLEPGDGEPAARTAGATHYRYDALDGTRCIVVEDDDDFRLRVPCFSASTLSAPRTNEVWMQIAYWDAPNNPEWVQDWQFTVTPDGGIASDPVLMGRVHGADGLITEAYAFTLVGDDTAFEVAFAADPTLSASNPGFVSAVTVDTRVRAPLAIADPAADGEVASETDSAVVTANTDGMVGPLTFRNATTGQAIIVPEGSSSAELTLAYGDNVIVVSGTDAAGGTVTATVTVTRYAPAPLNGTVVLPSWDTANGTGTVHVAWTTNDWYQFQSGATCLPGTFQYLDMFGNELLWPGDGDAHAVTNGTMHFRYDAGDASRCIVLEGNDAVAVRVPCYSSASTGLPMNQSVWLQVSFWDAPGNPGWVPGWQLTVTAEGPVGAGATAPVLMGRAYEPDGRITEAYAFTVTNDATAFAVSFAGDPAFSLVNAVHVSDVTADVIGDTAVPSHRILTAVSGNGTVSRGNILLASGASTNLVMEAAEWYRIASFTTNDTVVAAAAGAGSYTQQFENVTQDYANLVTFGLRPNSANPDSVPTAWLAGFGRGEHEQLVNSDRSIHQKHLLDLDPYATHTVEFGIDAFDVTEGLDGDVADVAVKLLVNGVPHGHINGTLQLDGRPTLDAEWAPISGTSATGNAFENGVHPYDSIETDANRFFRAVVR